MRIETIDLMFQGTPEVIAAFVLFGPDGPVLIETGPSSTQPTLLAGLKKLGLKPSDVRDVLVTHIHFDHAGAAGWWAQQGSRVWVHPNGAPHLIDPSKLIASATRIYGDRMDSLWGEILPAPADHVKPIHDGDILRVGGLRARAIDTPGHARHHHVFHVDDVAFSGDAAGILLPGREWIDLPAPPPEFDPVAWKRSLARLRDLDVKRLFRTHFGASTEVAAELEQFEQLLDHASELVREMFEQELERDEMSKRFTKAMRDLAEQTGIDHTDQIAYELANPREMSVDGIARYWRKQAESSEA